MKPVGYLHNTREGLAGDGGLFYDYILASNGLFVRAQNPRLRATVCVAPALVRGLAPLDEKVELAGGRIPRRVYDLAISVLCANPSREQFLAVIWDNAYRLESPLQEGSAAGVRYEKVPGTVVDIHSHGRMGAFFSWTDNQDEQGLCLYLVVGEVHTLAPEVLLRVGVYGHFAPVELEMVFDV